MPRSIEFSTSFPYETSHIDVHNSFMDTIGRPSVILTAHNAVEDWREKGDLVITYEYPWVEGFRKPLTIAAAIFGAFFTVWVVGSLDVRIGKRS
jgi:oligosaccharyltransferase complex subunit alpha (ribophorin I)